MIRVGAMRVNRDLINSIGGYVILGQSRRRGYLMNAHEFWGALKGRGLDFFSGVPDSTFHDAYNVMVADPEIRYVPAVREDVALGIASANYFTNGLGGVIMQNSGVGNLVNPLTSYSLMYKIPAFLVIGWRGYGGPPNDAPEHWVMGVKTPEILDLLEVPYEILEEDNLDSSLDRLLAAIKERSVPGALLVRAGVIQ
ncbi:MAG: sulfopyruvate decarboxylase subunit alpha [SAR202 cluster bacterium]|nr:sulfopyruvate decarboxylase subunit alpha [Chloroflexota bacterium]MQG33711.1 sulfopyruvate decarboxylase subunit alpha [SAR202 cluster bacterium]